MPVIKGRNFSVSFPQEELDELGEHLKWFREQRNYSVSRNEFIRRGMLVLMRAQRLGNKSVEELFNKID